MRTRTRVGFHRVKCVNARVLKLLQALRWMWNSLPKTFRGYLLLSKTTFCIYFIMNHHLSVIGVRSRQKGNT